MEEGGGTGVRADWVLRKEQPGRKNERASGRKYGGDEGLAEQDFWGNRWRDGDVMSSEFKL